MKFFNKNCIYGPADEKCYHASMIFQNGIDDCPKHIYDECPVEESKVVDAVANWLDAPPYEIMDDDGIIVAKYVRWIMSQGEKKKELKCTCVWNDDHKPIIKEDPTYPFSH